MRRYWRCRSSLRSVLMWKHCCIIFGMLGFFISSSPPPRVCVAGLNTITHLYRSYIDAYLLDHVEPEHLVIKLLLWMTDSIWECCCNHRKQRPHLPLAPLPPGADHEHIPAIDLPLMTPSRVETSAEPDAQTPGDWVQPSCHHLGPPPSCCSLSF